MSDLKESKEEAELSALMLQTQAGNRDAYRVLLGRIQDLIMPFIQNSLRRTGQANHPSSADVLKDITQETLLAIHQKLNTYDPSQFFLPWMYGITRYKTIDAIRDLKKRKAMSTDDPGFIATFPAPESEKEAGENSDTSRLLAALPEKQRWVLTLVKVNGLSIQEAALKTGFSCADVKVTIHRGIKALKKKMSEHQEEHAEEGVRNERS